MQLHPRQQLQRGLWRDSDWPSPLWLLRVGGMNGDPDLDDPKTRDKIAGDAVASEKLQQRGPDGEELSYAPNSQIPYTGWVKSMLENGQVKALKHYKDGKEDGLGPRWDDEDGIIVD